MIEQRVGDLTVLRFDTSDQLAGRAAADAAAAIRAALGASGRARVLAATGNSQLAFVDALARSHQDLDWSRVELFHLDEYAGLTADHPASFRRWMRQRYVEPLGIGRFHPVDGDASDPVAECLRYSRLLAEAVIDVAIVGMGENGHLAFNDPPVADFADPLAVKVVALDEASRNQQVGEGHFPDLASVPTHAITVTIPTILRAATVLAIVPERRKAAAVRTALLGPVATSCPASILRRASHARLYLDAEAASLL